MTTMKISIFPALSSLQRSVQVPSHLLPFARKGEGLLRCDSDCQLIFVDWWIGRICSVVFISTDQVSLNFTSTSAEASKLASKFFLSWVGMIFNHNSSPTCFIILLFQRLLWSWCGSPHWSSSSLIFCSPTTRCSNIDNHQNSSLARCRRVTLEGGLSATRSRGRRTFLRPLMMPSCYLCRCWQKSFNWEAILFLCWLWCWCWCCSTWSQCWWWPTRMGWLHSLSGRRGRSERWMKSWSQKWTDKILWKCFAHRKTHLKFRFSLHSYKQGRTRCWSRSARYYHQKNSRLSCITLPQMIMGVSIKYYPGQFYWIQFLAILLVVKPTMMMLLDHPDAVHADDRDADGGGNRLHCLLLSHQHCLGETSTILPSLMIWGCLGWWDMRFVKGCPY